MRRRRHVRTLALVVMTAAGVLLAACDTNDGRDMKPPSSYEEWRLQNTAPTTSTTTSTIAPPTTAAPESSAPVADSVEDTSAENSAAESVADAIDNNAAQSSTSVAGPATTVAPAEPVDTFAEALGLANLAAAGIDFGGPWIPGEAIPVEYTCNGDEIAPLLTWTAPPDDTVEMALVVVDETADDYAHWIIIGLPPEAGSVGGPEPVVVGSEAMNSVGDVGWAGTCPPDRDVHTYRFTLYALSQAIALPPGSLPAELIQAIEESASGAVSFTGTYQIA